MAISKFLRSALATGALLAGSFAANAAVVVYTFDNTAASLGAGPYGTITLTDNSGNVDVLVSLRSDLNFVNTGGPHAVFAFNAINAAAGDVTNIQFNGSSSSLFSVITDSSSQPFGQFELLIDCTSSSCDNGRAGNMPDPLTFTLLNSTVADFAFKSTGGSPSAYFASDVICMTGGCNGVTGSIGATTAPGGGGGPSGGDVPEPESGALALLGLGLLGLSYKTGRKHLKADTKA